MNALITFFKDTQSKNRSLEKFNISIFDVLNVNFYKSLVCESLKRYLRYQ